MNPAHPTEQDALQELFDRYHQWYYYSLTWTRTSFLGVPCLKSVSDMWNYQEILAERKPALIVEFGSAHGGSGLFFSAVSQLVRPGAKVLTVDIDHRRLDDRVRRDPHIEVLTASSADPLVARRIAELREERPGPVFAILDSAHDMDHVLAELKLLRPLLRPDDYLVVEDSNVNGHPVNPSHGDGPMEALLAYEAEHPFDYTHDLERERKFGFTFAPNGYLIRNGTRLAADAVQSSVARAQPVVRHVADLENRFLTDEIDRLKVENAKLRATLHRHFQHPLWRLMRRLGAQRLLRRLGPR